MKYKVSESLIREVMSLKNSNREPHEIKKFISDNLGCKKTKAGELYREIISKKHKCSKKSCTVKQSTEVKIKTLEDDSDEESLQLSFGPRYTFNKETKQYIVYLKAASRTVVVPEAMHKNMLKAYSNWNGSPQSLNEIARNVKLPRTWVEEYKSIMGWTHDHEPVSNEVLIESDPGRLAEEIISDKKIKLWQEFEKRSWKDVQREANNWREFLQKNVNPFEEALKNWNPPKYQGVPAYKYSNPGDDIYVMGCFDWHIGSLAEKRYLFRGKEWNMEKAKDVVGQYVTQIDSTVKNRVKPFKEGVILLGGDILHGLRGTTEKGTPLICDRIRDEQFDCALNLLKYLIESAAALFPKLSIYIVRGNHDGADMYPLAKVLEAYFHTESRITFHIYSQRTAAFKIGNVLTIMDHGASDTIKAQIPKGGKPRESYIQSLFLADPKLCDGVVQKIFVCGDLHRFQEVEHTDFEYVMFGALPLGDKYADNLNLHSRSRQNCIVIGSDGIKEVVHIYLE